MRNRLVCRRMTQGFDGFDGIWGLDLELNVLQICSAVGLRLTRDIHRGVIIHEIIESTVARLLRFTIGIWQLCPRGTTYPDGEEVRVEKQ